MRILKKLRIWLWHIPKPRPRMRRVDDSVGNLLGVPHEPGCTMIHMGPCEVKKDAPRALSKLWVRIWHIPVCAVFHGKHHRYHSMGYDHDYHTCTRCHRFWRVPRPGQGGGLWTPSQGKAMNARAEFKIREHGGRF